MRRTFFKSLSLTATLLLTASAIHGGEDLKRLGQFVIMSIDTAHVHTLYMEAEKDRPYIYNERIDELVTNWYINNIFNPGEFEYDSVVYQHVMIPDSVVIARLKKIEAAVPLSYNPSVRAYIDMYLTRKPELVEKMIGLTTYYFPVFEEVFDKYSLPLELKYLSIIESALNPMALSRAGAVGLWQFMYGTAKGLNIEISTFVDERRDVLKSTDAAARYLDQLYDAYQDWHLVIAAYNCGPGNVNKAIARSGGKNDYWQIFYALPKETRDYVPAYIAASYVMNYYREHKLTPKFPSLALNTDTIMIGNYLNLKQISDNLHIDLENLRELNPMFRRDIIPGTSEKKYPLRIPSEHIASFIQKSDVIYNHEREILFPDKSLATAQPLEKDEVYESDPSGKTKITYTVKKGDNPGYIARWFDVNVSDLKRWNNINRNIIRVGQKLTIYVPETQARNFSKINLLSFSAKQALNGNPPRAEAVASKSTPAKRTESKGEFIYYTVKKGDNLWTIARKYPGISNNDIMQLNNITNARSLKAGQKLKIRPKS